ncbi:MAG: hypothetical protein RL885_19450 [Planctomycetota bacterium]
MHAIPSRQHRSYDHRLKLLVRTTGDLTATHGLGIPRSTARGWLEGDRPVVSLEVLDQDTLSLRVPDVLGLFAGTGTRSESGSRAMSAEEARSTNSAGWPVGRRGV